MSFCIKTWYIVVGGLDACGEVGVFWDGVGEVVEVRQLRQDLRVPRHQNRRKNCREDEEETASRRSQLTEPGLVRRGGAERYPVSPPSGSGRD